MSSQWFVKRGDKARGPFTAERLKELAVEGKLKPTDEVREGDSGEWVEASRLDWLFPSEPVGEDDPAVDEPPAPRKKRPAQSSGSPVEKAKALYQKNPQKALLLGGGVLLTVMMMGMCVCAGMFSLVGGAGKTTAPSVEGGVDRESAVERERAKTLVNCGKSVIAEAKIGASPAQIKSMMAVKARAAGIQGLKPTNEENMMVEGKAVFLIQYGSDVTFTFMKQRVGTMGLFGGIIDGEKFFPLGDQ